MKFVSFSDPQDYEEISVLQKKLVELRAEGKLEDVILSLEHTPVVTRGRGLQWTGQPREKQIPIASPLPAGISYVESERGGDLTYHGPGQWVVYPILKLGESRAVPKKDVVAYIRKLEIWIIDLLCSYELECGVRPNATGIWLGDQKIASIGIAVKRWVTYHGIALNVVNDLKPFHLIQPCGFLPEVMTRMKDQIKSGQSPKGESPWKQDLERRFCDLLKIPEVIQVKKASEVLSALQVERKN